MPRLGTGRTGRFVTRLQYISERMLRKCDLPYVTHTQVLVDQERQVRARGSPLLGCSAGRLLRKAFYFNGAPAARFIIPEF